jgi:hypothetical protein
MRNSLRCPVYEGGVALPLPAALQGSRLARTFALSSPAIPAKNRARRTASLSFARASETDIDTPLPAPLPHPQYAPQKISQPHTHQLGGERLPLWILI